LVGNVLIGLNAELDAFKMLGQLVDKLLLSDSGHVEADILGEQVAV
jgi:hypothetical protein